MLGFTLGHFEPLWLWLQRIDARVYFALETETVDPFPCRGSMDLCLKNVFEAV
jgi:hypothetical protein